jgi:hypothetical protein
VKPIAEAPLAGARLTSPLVPRKSAALEFWYAVGPGVPRSVPNGSRRDEEEWKEAHLPEVMAPALRDAVGSVGVYAPGPGVGIPRGLMRADVDTNAADGRPACPP